MCGKVRQEGFEQLLVGRGAKADRIRDALAERRAFVRDAGRQVEHVARLQHEFRGGLKVREDLQRQAVDPPQVALPADAPAAATDRLQQEYIVGIGVRTHASAVGRVAHHQIVESGIGNEAEALQQPVRAFVQQVDALHQQRPARAPWRRQPRKRSVRSFQAPLTCSIRRASPSG